MILAIAFAAPFWIGVLGAYFADSSYTVEHRVLSGIYAATEVAFAAVVFRLAAGPGLRTKAYRYIATVNQQTGINYSTLWTLHFVKKRTDDHIPASFSFASCFSKFVCVRFFSYANIEFFVLVGEFCSFFSVEMHFFY